MTAKFAMFSAVTILFALLLPQAASADLWGCVFTNGAPCTWVCFETDLTGGGVGNIYTALPPTSAVAGEKLSWGALKAAY